MRAPAVPPPAVGAAQPAQLRGAGEARDAETSGPETSGSGITAASDPLLPRPPLRARSPAYGTCERQSATPAGSSSASPSPPPGGGCVRCACRAALAAVAAPALFAVMMAVFAAQQLVALPFRCACPRLLRCALLPFAGVVNGTLLTLAELCAGLRCYGAALDGVRNLEGHLARIGGTKARCNVRTSCRKAGKQAAALGVGGEGGAGEWRRAGEWRITAEHRSVLMEHCRRKNAGSLHWWQTWYFTAFGEWLWLLGLPLDVLEWRDGDGRLVAFGTTCVLGNVYFCANWCASDAYGRAGLHWLGYVAMLEEGIAEGSSCINMSPGAENTKILVGMGPLPPVHLCGMLLCCRCG